MIDVKQNTYYKRLAKLALWPLVGLVGLVAVIVLSLVLVFHLKYVPELLAPIEQLVSPEIAAFVASGVNKIIVSLSVWIYVLCAVNVLFIYVLWNVKKLLSKLVSEK